MALFEYFLLKMEENVKEMGKKLPVFLGRKLFSVLESCQFTKIYNDTTFFGGEQAWDPFFNTVLF